MPRYNERPIDKALCETDNLIFYPKSVEESLKIQNALIALGYQWPEGPRALPNPEILQNGLVLLQQKIYMFHKADTRDYLICTAEQLLPDYTQPGSPQDHFNKLSARVDGLEQKLDRVIELLERKAEKKKLEI